MIDFKARSFLFFSCGLFLFHSVLQQLFLQDMFLTTILFNWKRSSGWGRLWLRHSQGFPVFSGFFFSSLVMCFWHFKKLLVCLNVIQSSLTLKKPCGVGEGRPVQCWLFPFPQWPKTSFSTFLSFISKMVIAMPALNCHRIVVRLK